MVRELHLFAGIGGGVLASEMILGTTPVAFVEKEPFCRHILQSRYPHVPCFDDVRSFNPSEVGAVDVVSGGFPCQDISIAGKGAGLSGTRSGLWFEMLRIIAASGASVVFIENSPALRTRGLGVVLRGLADHGFDAAWTILGADDVAAPHRRKRMWVLGANPNRGGLEILRSIRESAWKQPWGNTDGLRPDVSHPLLQGLEVWPGSEAERSYTSAVRGGWWSIEPDVGRVVDGYPSRVDQIKALGNAQVPEQAAKAFLELAGEMLAW